MSAVHANPVVALVLAALDDPSVAEKVRAIIGKPLTVATKPALLTRAALAAEVGCDAKCLSERFRRARKAGRVHPLEVLAIEIDGRTMWRTEEVQQVIAEIGRGK